MDFEVIVVGGGPVGMMLASELALAEVKVCVLEDLKETTPYSRALTLHPRTLEIFDSRGLKEKIMSKGIPISEGHFAVLDTPLDFSTLDSTSNYTVFLPQHDTEKELEKWARSLGVEIRRGEKVESVRQDHQGVEVVSVSSNGESVLSAAYVVGADGGGSIVRKQANILFVGKNSTFTALMGDVVLSNPPESSVVSRFSERGLVMVAPVNAQLHRVVMVDPQRMDVPKEEPVTLEELRSGLVRILGSDLGISESFWLSRFGNATRQVERYREGRILLAGDAAHIHFPAGGQGLNVGLQEAMNLGWKLAAEIHGWAPDWLLDSYHDERFPISTAMLKNTEVQTLLFEFSPRMIELRNMLSNMLKIPESNYLLSTQISGFNVKYETDAKAPPHALNGHRFTELKLRLENGTIRNAYELFHSGTFLLLHLDSDECVNEAVDWSRYKHVQVVRATLAEETSDWKDVHTALIRPDGYIAWAVSKSELGRIETIRKGIIRWCGGHGIS